MRVGVLLPLRGRVGPTGERCRVAVEVALQRTRAEHPGCSIETVIADVTTADEAEREVTRLISEERVGVLLGTVESPEALRASAVASARGVPHFEVAAVGDELTRRGLPGIFRFAPRGSAYGGAAGRFVAERIAPLRRKTPGELRVAVLHSDNVLGHSVAAGARATAAAAGVPIAHLRAVNAAEPAESIATDLAGRGLDAAIVVQLLDRLPAVLRLLGERDAAIPAVLGSAGWGYRRSADNPGPFAEGTFVVGAPSFGTFRTDGIAAGALADQSAWMAHCGDLGPAHNLALALDRDLFFCGARVLFAALAGAPAAGEPAAIAALLRGLDLPLGSTPFGWGVRFGPEGENERSFIAVSQWQDGGRRTVWPESLATGTVRLPGAASSRSRARRTATPTPRSGRPG